MNNTNFEFNSEFVLFFDNEYFDIKINLSFIYPALHYKFVYENKGAIKQRKQKVNAFIRQALFYDDEIVITYTFTDNPEHLKKTKESSLKTEKK